MEAMQDVDDNATRDSDFMDLDVEELQESVCDGGDRREEGRAMMKMSIRTKSLFNFMELPPEVRVQIYKLILVSPEVISIGSDKTDSSTADPRLLHPPNSILRTCRKVDEEATPIMYGQNTFAICLPNDPSPTFLLSKFRWTTLSVLKSLTFTSNIASLAGLPLTDTPISDPGFHCTGKEILARFIPADFRFSPIGPDYYMALSISNWVSTKVLGAQLSAIQKELELMMGPHDDVLTAVGNPVT